MPIGIQIEIQEQAEGVISCFIRNDDDTVTCPMGYTLFKLRMRGDCTIYGSKEACRNCKNRCTASKDSKHVSFGPDTDIVPVRMYGEGAAKARPIPPNLRMSENNHSLDRLDNPDKKVVIRIPYDKQKLHQRMCLPEHPFGTVKWHHGAHYLLCKGKEKANAELGLSFLVYNMKRVISMIGIEALVSAM